MTSAAFPNIAATGSVDRLLVEMNGDGIYAMIPMHFGDDFGPDTHGVKEGIHIAPGFVAGCSGPVPSHRGLEHVSRYVWHGVFPSHLSYATWYCSVLSQDVPNIDLLPIDLLAA